MTHGRGNAMHLVCTLGSLATAHSLSLVFQVTLDGFKCSVLRMNCEVLFVITD